MRFFLMAALMGGCAEAPASWTEDTGGAPDADPGVSTRRAPRQLEEVDATYTPGGLFSGTLTRTSGVWDGAAQRWARIDCMYRWTLNQVQTPSVPRGCTSCVASFEVSRSGRTDMAYTASPGTFSSCPGAFIRDGGTPQVLPTRVYTFTSRPAVWAQTPTGWSQWSRSVTLDPTSVHWLKDF